MRVPKRNKAIPLVKSDDILFGARNNEQEISVTNFKMEKEHRKALKN